MREDVADIGQPSNGIWAEYRRRTSELRAHVDPQFASHQLCRGETVLAQAHCPVVHHIAAQTRSIVSHSAALIVFFQTEKTLSMQEPVLVDRMPFQDDRSRYRGQPCRKWRTDPIGREKSHLHDRQHEVCLMQFSALLFPSNGSVGMQTALLVTVSFLPER